MSEQYLEDFHSGLDISAAIGTEIRSTANGVVIKTGKNNGFGNFVLIKHKYGIETFYAHCHSIRCKKGQAVKKGEIIATIESVKAAADVNSPVGGVLKEVNEELVDTPELLNSDPFVKGWMVKIEMDSPTDTDDLLTSKDYDTFCESR